MSDTHTEAWRGRVDDKLADIESRMAHIEKSAAVEEVHRTNVEARLTKIEANLTWLIRLILGALVMAVITFALSGGLVLV